MMGFDQNTPEKPLVNVRKPDTKTNLLMTIGVVLFLAVAAGLMLYYMWNPEEPREEVHEEYAP